MFSGLLRIPRRAVWAAAMAMGSMACLNPGAARADGAAAFTAEAEAVMQQIRGAMMKEMQSAMAKGPAEAIDVCRHLAPEISRKIEQETGWTIRRVGLKVRNPANRPNDEERGLLLGYEMKQAAGQPPNLLRTSLATPKGDKVTIHVMQAIPTFDGCLPCHGNAIDPVTAKAIHDLYPEDEAVGYKVGDIRGAFSLYKTVNLREFRAADAGTAPAGLAAMGYKPKTTPDARGSATEGDKLFTRHCQSCHSPQDLAALFFDGKPAAETKFCRKLETHGFTDEKSDCDILAFLKDVARFLANARK